jgi:hypothetical protein
VDGGAKSSPTNNPNLSIPLILKPLDGFKISANFQPFEYFEPFEQRVSTQIFFILTMRLYLKPGS